MNQESQSSILVTQIAQVVHTALAWEEAMDGDYVDDFCEALKKELNELNGNN